MPISRLQVQKQHLRGPTWAIWRRRGSEEDIKAQDYIASHRLCIPIFRCTLKPCWPCSIDFGAHIGPRLFGAGGQHSMFMLILEKNEKAPVQKRTLPSCAPSERDRKEAWRCISSEIPNRRRVLRRPQGGPVKGPYRKGLPKTSLRPVQGSLLASTVPQVWPPSMSLKVTLILRLI